MQITETLRLRIWLWENRNWIKPESSFVPIRFMVIGQMLINKHSYPYVQIDQCARNQFNLENIIINKSRVANWKIDNNL